MDEPASFASLQRWIDELRTHTNGGVGIVICGTKFDIENPRVSQTEAEKWADVRNYTVLFTSAVTGQNVDVLIDHIVKNYVVAAKAIQVGPQPATKKEEGQCC
jgi:GTPase SAR1 family protein